MARKTERAGFGVIGLGRFGMSLARALAQAGEDVLVVDISEATIQQAREFAGAAYVIESPDRQTLMDVGIQNCQTVIIGIGERIDTSILTTLTVKQLGVPRVIAKAISEDQGAVLEKLGAEVVFPESDMALRLARQLTMTNVLDYLSLRGGIEVTELRLEGDIIGRTVAQADLRGKYGLNIIALLTPGGTKTDITPGLTFAQGDVAVVIGNKEGIKKFEQRLHEA